MMVDLCMAYIYTLMPILMTLNLTLSLKTFVRIVLLVTFIPAIPLAVRPSLVNRRDVESVMSAMILQRRGSLHKHFCVCFFNFFGFT